MKLIKYIFLLFFFIFTVSLFAQPNRKPIYIESNTIFSGESASTFISFKVPHNNLVFVKDNDKYYGGLTFTIEVYDNDTDDLVKRESTTRKITLETYDDTESPELFMHGVLLVNLEPGKYNVLPLVELENTSRSIKLERFFITVEKPDTDKLNPMVLTREKTDCESADYILVNHENKVPFGDKNAIVMFSIPDEFNSTPDIKLSLKESEVASPSVSLQKSTGVSLSECEHVITVKTNNSNGNTLVLLDQGLENLEEGKYELELNFNGTIFTSGFSVEWINQPFSLSNPKFAIELVKIAYGEEKARELLRTDEENYYSELVKFWKKYDPVKSTEFNELMDEYYRRADYSIRHFSSLDKRNGAETDRGKTFIKFGYPDSIKRGSNDKDKITEIWYYGESGRSFVFVDETGLGNFVLK